MTTDVMNVVGHMIAYAAAGSNHKTATSCVLTTEHHLLSSVYTVCFDVREKYHGDIFVEKYFAGSFKSEI
jgi:hypothetical protein